MIKKISSLLLIFVLLVAFVTGCESKEKEETEKSSKVEKVEDLSNKKGTLHCVRNATVEGGSGKFNYYVDYNGDVITYIDSEDSVTIEDEAKRKEYEDSFRTLDSYYTGIDYYYAKVIVEGNTVTHRVKIDYEKVDISKLIALEGEEDNIYENNIPKLNKYLELGKKVGVTCSESTL